MSSSCTRGSAHDSDEYHPENSGGFINPVLTGGFQLECDVPQCCIGWVAKGATAASTMAVCWSDTGGISEARRLISESYA